MTCKHTLSLETCAAVRLRVNHCCWGTGEACSLGIGLYKGTAADRQTYRQCLLLGHMACCHTTRVLHLHEVCRAGGVVMVLSSRWQVLPPVGSWLSSQPPGMRHGVSTLMQQNRLGLAESRYVDGHGKPWALPRRVGPAGGAGMGQESILGLEWLCNCTNTHAGHCWNK